MTTFREIDFTSFQNNRNVIVLTVFLLIMNQKEFRLIQNQKENSKYDNIPFNLDNLRCNSFIS